MSEIEGGFEDMLRSGEAPPVPVREGLPPTYRMRASSHYVEQLDSDSFSSPVKYIDATTIDVHGDEPQPAGAFVESIRRHGVLQPLLVQGRDGRYRLIAGRKRLSAALAAGLREVPCLVQRVGEREATLLAAATNLASVESVDPSVDEPPVKTDIAGGALARCIAALASSANLLSAGTALSNSVAVDLVKAEAARALQLMQAIRVLRDDATVARAIVPARAIADRAVQSTGAERRLRGLDLVVISEGAGNAAVDVDEDLLAGAVAGLLAATGALLEGARTRRLMLTISEGLDGSVTYRVSQDSVRLPGPRLAHLFEAEGFDGADAAAVGVLLQAARRVVETHGGRTTAIATDRGTSLELTLPAHGEDRA